jgi:hypothetical protein
MNKKIIKTTLDPKELNRAIKEIKAYKKRIISKALELRERVAEELMSEAQNGFNSAVMEDLLNSGGRIPEATVSLREKGNITLVIASGEDAIWCEFGSGVYFNAPAGVSPHPKGAELGMTIGDYGKGYGQRNVWGYYDNGELKLTHGTRTQMPMFNAMLAVSQKISQIAKEVFS